MFVSIFVPEEPNLKTQCMQLGCWIQKHSENTLCLLSYAFESTFHIETEILSSIALKDSIDAPMV